MVVRISIVHLASQLFFPSFIAETFATMGNCPGSAANENKKSLWGAQKKISNAFFRDIQDCTANSAFFLDICEPHGRSDRKSTRLNSSHSSISYSLFFFLN